MIPIQISVYDHKLIIWNAGQLLPDWSLAQLMAKHPSQPANPDLAGALFLAGKIESWGRGIDLICNACLAHGSPAPHFDCDSTGFWVEFPFPVVKDAEKTATKAPGETLVKARVETPAAVLQRLAADPTLTLAVVLAVVGPDLRGVTHI